MTKRNKTKAARVRALIKQGLDATAIAHQLGITRQYVYCIKSYDKKKALGSAAPARKVGRPKGSKNKTEKKPVHYPIYVEVPVPQPFSHYSFWQRLRILFTGSHA